MPEKAAELTPLEAIEHYERAVKEEPNSGEMFMELGAAYYIAHRWDEAIGALEQAVRLKPDLGHAHYYLGVLYATKGESEKARKELESIVYQSTNPILIAQAKARIIGVKDSQELATKR